MRSCYAEQVKDCVSGCSVFGLIAAYGICNFLSERQKTEDTLRAANQEIVVAAQDIPPGTIFNEETMKKV